MYSVVEAAPRAAAHDGWRRRLFAAIRRQPRCSRCAPARLVETPPIGIDPVALTIMAVERLGPAAWRALLSGTPVTVTAPDAETAEIFRAALSRMAEQRPIHRLISVKLAKS